jgi:Tripartite tricarboxylate transporter family receptor
MKLPHRQFLQLAAGSAALPAVSRIARAQAYPICPIMMIVPFAAGGPVDTVARILSEPLRASLGQPVIVENITGAGGTIGVGRVARGAGRLHAQHWPLEHACGQRRDLSVSLRLAPTLGNMRAPLACARCP